MLISDFTYQLDSERIAKYPMEPRDKSKLLFFDKGQIRHHIFDEICQIIPKNAHLVFNNTKVIPARMFFQRKSGATIEVFLLNPTQPSTVVSVVMEENHSCVWDCVIGNKKKWKEGELLEALCKVENQNVTIKASFFDREKNLVKFEWDFGIPFSSLVEAFGKIPLPPYLNRESEESDLEDYQTVYSLNKGAVAAPTAGLHFTDKILDNLKANGLKESFLTLHVGAGTFMPIKTDNLLEHPMHDEQMVFSLEFIKNLKENLEMVIPVGTTSMRSLESLYWFGVKLVEQGDTNFFIEKLFAYNERENIEPELALQKVIDWMQIRGLEELVGQTEIMIFPSYKFRICKGLITNFHQPSSTLLMLVAAFVGETTWKEIYNVALSSNYRFLSFGDSSLLIPN
jgi:S-adenosylmethionine:tRNA ribosyltransferase-isomerase